MRAVSDKRLTNAVIQVRNASVSPRLRAKYEDAKSALQAGGFTLVDGEWPEKDSVHFGRRVNAAIDSLFGNRRINNRDYDGVGAPHLHSFTGQVAEWVKTYLAANVSLQEIWDTSEDGGDGHSPRGFYILSAVTDESQMRAVGHVQADKLRVWNSYFDEHQVDAIMTPGQLCDAITFAGMANSSLPITAQQADGSYRETKDGSIVHCNLVHYFAFKDIPIPKVSPSGRARAVPCAKRMHAFMRFHNVRLCTNSRQASLLV